MIQQYASLFDTISILFIYQAANEPGQSNIHYNIQQLVIGLPGRLLTYPPSNKRCPSVGSHNGGM